MGRFTWLPGLGFDYLCVVIEVGFEDVFDVCRVCCVNLGTCRTKDSEGFMLPCKVRMVVMQPTEVDELVEEGACKWMISPLPSIEELEKEGSENKSSSYGNACQRKRTGKEIHGI